MKPITKLMMFILMTGMLALSLTSLASARETIELRKAGAGGYSYMIQAYDSLRREHYFLSGPITSDAHKILITKGWVSTITVYGPRHTSGSRNCYQEKDEVNPILEVQKVAEFKLVLKRVGYLPRTWSASPDGPFERKPPQ